THHLIGTVQRLILIELDNELAASWTAEVAERDDVCVVHGDVLGQPFWQHVQTPTEALVVGNIPYNITSLIIFRLLERPRPREIVLMVQQEVAERLTAAVGSKAYGALTVGVRSVATVKRLFGVRRGAFRPVPGVDSAVIRISPLHPEPLLADDEHRLRTIVRSAFQWRRKQMGKILRDHPGLSVPVRRLAGIAESAGFALNDRPERLSPEAFIRLVAALPSI
ncbi:MAG TPA: ribosomal RNA small subunit methyltransferase A, partial [Gemmatimonadetes bacterium]|nr:ribosomal RNA small subunit methyltransferase A [Gemmatimonadota bacterium]